MPIVVRHRGRALQLSRVVATAGLAAAAALTACGGGSGGGSSNATSSACGVEAQKQFVVAAARDWYLFLELLPPTIDSNAYTTASDLLDALTAAARAQSKDRFFSYLTTISSENQFFSVGASVGFGISTVVRNSNQLFLTQVFEGSAAAEAGFVRGDEILAIGTSAATLQDMAVLLATSTGFADAIGPAQAGITRTFRVRTQQGATVIRTVTKRDFSLNPVPTAVAIARTGTPPVGYVNLRTFVEPANTQLRSAFARFQASNVRNIVIDLRYNGGGLVDTAEILLNLLSTGRTGQVMYQSKLNARHTGDERVVSFSAEQTAIAPLRIAFLATGGTASASELVINSLAPYAQVAIIGDRTFGKPVGQFAFDLGSSCDTRLRLVTFKSLNSAGDGDYFGGLPDAAWSGGFCAAADDLGHPQGDTAETMTATALFWITSNACPAAAGAQLSAAAGANESSYLRLRGPIDAYRAYQAGAL
ncbi:MAG: S41 family peptidase [Steroidobacteraceae bacterium]